MQGPIRKRNEDKVQRKQTDDAPDDNLQKTRPQALAVDNFGYGRFLAQGCSRKPFTDRIVDDQYGIEYRQGRKTRDPPVKLIKNCWPC